MASLNQRIGLVLSAMPGYSETFFTSKVNGLSSLGYTFIIFGRGKGNPGLRCRLVQPYPVFRGNLLRFFSLCVVLPVVFFRAPFRCLRLWKFEKDAGKGSREIIRSLYFNAHILPYALNWLHFGFASVAIGRENVAKAVGAKLAVSFRGFDINVYPLKHPLCYDRLWKNVDKIHSISHYLVGRAQSIGLPSSAIVKVIAPAVDMNLMMKSNYEMRQPVKIVTVARLTWVKGLPFALQAVAILKARGIRVTYDIVGEGSEREHLLHEIHELKLTNEVSLLGKLPHEQTLDLVSECDIYIQPSINEGFCNSVLEAQAMGCLCIGTKVGGLVENIENEVTGWLVLPRDSEALANRIQATIELSIAERKRISSQASKQIRERFRVDGHLSQWQSFYSNE